MTLFAPSQSRLPISVLLVEDDDELRYILAHSLQQEGYGVTELNSLRDLEVFIEELRITPPGDRRLHVIVSDVEVGERSVLRLLAKKHRFTDSFPIVLMTADRSPEVLLEAKRLGLTDVLSKPFDFITLRRSIERSIQQKNN